MSHVVYEPVTQPKDVLSYRKVGSDTQLEK